MATRILAVLNQKGGVGKTTTCVNLGAALARRGLRVLLIDMDPQANLTVHLGLEPSQLQRTTYSLLIGQHGLTEAVQQTGVPGLFVVPSTLALANAEIQLASTVGRELVLREALEAWLHPSPEGDGAMGGGALAAAIGGAAEPESNAGTTSGAARPSADFVLIDCPPSLGTLTMNALCAAGEVLLPIQTEFFALQGVAGILESVRAVQRLNKGLRLSLVVPSLVDRRTTLARDVLDEVRGYFGDIVTKTEIRKNIKLAEAPSHGKTIFEWEPRCNGALDYESLAAEVLGESVPERDAPAVDAPAVDAPEGEPLEPSAGTPPDAPAQAESPADDHRVSGANGGAAADGDAARRPAEEASHASHASHGEQDVGETRDPLPSRSSGIGLAPGYANASDEDPGARGQPVAPLRTEDLTPDALAVPQSAPAHPAVASLAERLPAAVRESIPTPDPERAAAPQRVGGDLSTAASAAPGSTATTQMPADTGTAELEPASAPVAAERATGTPAPAGAARTETPLTGPRRDDARASWWSTLRRSALGRNAPGS